LIKRSPFQLFDRQLILDKRLVAFFLHPIEMLEGFVSPIFGQQNDADAGVRLILDLS